MVSHLLIERIIKNIMGNKDQLLEISCSKSGVKGRILAPADSTKVPYGFFPGE